MKETTCKHVTYNGLGMCVSLAFISMVLKIRVGVQQNLPKQGIKKIKFHTLTEIVWHCTQCLGIIYNAWIKHFACDIFNSANEPWG
jgi:hypothetical protein